MKKEYIIEENDHGTVIWYEENGTRYSFPQDEANSDYQAYLNKDNPEKNNPVGGN